MPRVVSDLVSNSSTIQSREATVTGAVIVSDSNTPTMISSCHNFTFQFVPDDAT